MTPNQALQRTAGPDRFSWVLPLPGPAAAELGRSAAEGVRMVDHQFKWKRGDHWFEGVGTVDVPLLGAKLRFEADHEGDAVTETQTRALAQLLALTKDDLAAMTHRVALNCCYSGDDQVNLKKRADVWDHVKPEKVMIPRHGKSKDLYVFVFAECDWEEEHGLSLLFKNGKLFEVSSQSGLFLNEEWSLYYINE